MLIVIALAAGGLLTLVIVVSLGVAFAIKSAGAKRNNDSRTAHIDHAEFSFRTPRGWTTRVSTSAPVLFIIEPHDDSAAWIHIESIRAWRGGQEFSVDNISEYLPGSGVRHQRDEMGGAEAVVGFSQDKSLGIWHCFAGTRRNGKDYIVRAQGPDREELIDAVFLVRKTWKWKP